ncbi:unnamed protein product, partial [Gongylonema pulchrum]|uniref:Transmembrane protein n=1 Tax=Gongylonema pulchrum TaxID=637853 RepID=A0A183DBW8_9BILA
MFRTLIAVTKQEYTPNSKYPTSLSSKSAASLRHVAKSSGTSQEWRATDDSVGTILTSFGSLLALIEVETDLMSKVIADVSAEAKVQQLLFGRPLLHVVERASTLLDGVYCSLIPLLPLLKHISVHYLQLLSLANVCVYVFL